MRALTFSVLSPSLFKVTGHRRRRRSFSPVSRRPSHRSGMSSSFSASALCNVSGSSNSSESMKDPYPLWKFVVKGDRISGGGGNYNWKCNFCSEVKNGSYTRVKAHLLCETGKGIQTYSKVKIDDPAKLRKLHRESQDYKKSLLPKVPPFSNEPIFSHTSIEATLVRLGGLPFNLSRNPYYVSSYTIAANSNFSSYKPPGYNKLRITLLCKETENVDSENWSLYKDDRRGQASYVREKILDEIWWEKVDYILDFTRPIYDMIRVCDTDQSSLHLVYKIWDIMVQKVKDAIYKKEGKLDYEESTFFNVVKGILSSRWSKGSTPLHSLAHSLNPRFYTEEWLNEVPGRVVPNANNEISTQRLQCFRRLFQSRDERFKINTEFAIFSQKLEGIFLNIDCMHDMAMMDAKNWWATYGSQVPMLQALAYKLLGQPSSSSCSERNWSTYKFIHSCTRNKLTHKCAQDLVFIHNNLRLLSRRSEEHT
uniref:HAT C-terminal dimerisation domain-containing protein n=1 Tax=Chenopodium quinoa TaxID=63459 RepID=A0A803KP61_CHEQI